MKSSSVRWVIYIHALHILSNSYQALSEHLLSADITALNTALQALQLTLKVISIQ